MPSPIAGQNTTRGPADTGTPFTPGALMSGTPRAMQETPGGSPARRRPQQQQTRRVVQSAPLTSDPRSGLPLIEIPRDRQHAFAHLGLDILLHLFMDVDRMSSKSVPLRRVLLVTDQTLFVCEETGGILRCLQVSKIMQVNVATDNSNAISLVIPSEYDVILRFDHRQKRDDAILVLRAVYRRMTDTELNVQMVKDIRAAKYRMEKPANFQLQRIPQRTRQNLQQALDAIQQQELDRADAIEAVQSQLVVEHTGELKKKQSELQAVQAKLEEAQSRVRQQHEELDRLRVAYGKCRKRVDEIEGQYTGPGGEPVNKDGRIRELQEVVEALTASVSKAADERAAMMALSRQGDFEQRDLDAIDGREPPRYRGRSLHQQGLVEVLQRQLLEKQQQLESLQSKQGDLQKLKLDVLRKEELLRETEALVPLARRDNDPTMLFANTKGASVDEMLAKYNTTYSPPRPGERYTDPALNIGPSLAVNPLELRRDEDGDTFHTGVVPQAKITVAQDIPEFRLPADESAFTHDPRTGLKFIEVPPLFQDVFTNLQGAIIHFFGVGTKSNKRGREQKRVLVVNDQSIYQCNSSGNINRCIWITAVREIIYDPAGNVALLVDGANEYDLALRFDKIDTAKALADVLMQICKFLKRKPPLKVTPLHDRNINFGDLKLEKPPQFDFKLHAIRPKAALFRALSELSRANAEDRLKLTQEADQQTLDVIQRLKEEMRPEINLRREREFAVLRQQLAILDGGLREKHLEVRNLKRQISEHRCTVDHVKIQQGGGADHLGGDEFNSTSHEASGMYWIPSEPVVMESDLEVLHLLFDANFVVTSHANGFINVWDIQAADLYRTLKNGHTARVQAFCFEGTMLVSGGFDASLRRWNLTDGSCETVVAQAHRGAIHCLAMDHRYVISGGADAAINIYDAASLQPRRDKAGQRSFTLAGHRGPVLSMSLYRNTLASAEWGWIFLWDVEKGIANKTFRDDYGGINSVALHGMTLVSGGTAGVLNVWNISTGESTPLEGHTDDVYRVQIQDNFAVSSSADCTIRMWNVSDMAPLGIFHNSYPYEIKNFHFRANRFVVAEQRTIKVWTR